MRASFFACLLLCSTQVFASERYNYESALDLFQQQEYGAAFIHLRHVLHDDPNNLPATLLLGSIMYQQARFFEAIYLFEEALSGGADINLVFSELLTSYQIAQQSDAILRLKGYSSLNSANRFDLLIAEVQVHLKHKDFTAAQQALEEAKRLRAPNDIAVINSETRLSIAKRKYDLAAELIAKSLAADAARAESWRLQGDVLRLQQALPDALEAYHTAYELAPDDPINMRSLSAAYIATGQVSQARKLLDQMADLGLQDPYLRFSRIFLTTISNDSTTAQAGLQTLQAELAALPISYFEQKPEQLYMRAASAYLLGNAEQALRDYEIYLQLVPDDLEALLVASEIHRNTRERTQTLRFLEQHQALVALSPQLLALQAQLALELERLEFAEKLILNARVRFPDFEPLLLLDSRIQQRLYGAEYAASMLQQPEVEQSARVVLRLALLAIEQQNFAQAKQLATQLVELEPTANNLHLMAGISLKSGDLATAEAVLNQIFEDEPKHFLAQLAQANIYLQTGQWALAEETLVDLLARQPRHMQVTTLLASAEFQLGKPQQAEKRLTELLNRQYYRPSLELLVQYYISVNQLDAALAIIQRALRQEFMEPQLLLLQARVYAMNNDFERARRTLGLIANQPSLTADIRFQLAQSYLIVNDTDLAATSLQALVQEYPEELLYRLEYVQLLLNTSDLAEANKQLERLMAMYPSEPNTYLLNAEFQRIQGNMAESVTFFNKSIALDPFFQRAWAGFYEISREPIYRDAFSNKATEYLSMHTDFHWLRRLLAEHSMNHQLYADAQVHYIELLANQVFSDDAMLLNNLAITLLEQDASAALVHATEAVRLTPNHAKRLTTLARALINTNQHEGALSRLRQAYSLDSSSDEVLYLTAVCLTHLNRPQEAKSLLNQLIARNGSIHYTEKATRLLSTL